MNLVFLCRLYKPHVGGVEKHVEEISKILSRNHTITIITEKYDPELTDHEKYLEAEVYRIPLENTHNKGKKWVIWKWIWQHRQLLYGADIIHIHDVFFWLLPLIPLFIKPVLFMTFHGYEGSKPPGFKQILWHKLAEWLTWGNICIGDFHRKWYHVHPDIVSYGATEHYPVKKVKSNGKAIFVGRLDEDTGIIDYLRAAQILNIPVDVYGDGPLLNSAKEIAGKSSKIIFHGFIPDAVRFLPGYQVAFISRYLGILEGLYARIPIIAHSDSPIKFDYLHMAPFSKYIYLVKSPEEIIQAVKEIRSKPVDTISKAAAGYNWVKDQTWDRLAGQYQLLWQKNSPPRYL